MTYGYAPKFSNRGATGFGSLDLWLQEEVLDEIDRLLESVPAPTVAQRLGPHPTIHDMVRIHDGRQHYVFITTVLDVARWRRASVPLALARPPVETYPPPAHGTG